MLRLSELSSFVRVASSALTREHDLGDFEIYCSSSEQIVARLNYTSDIPCRGVEELKSLAGDGIALRIAMKRNPHESGAAFEPGEPSLDALRRCLERARHASVVDPDFSGLPAIPREPKPGAIEANDLIAMRDGVLVQGAWAILRAALSSFRRGSRAAFRRALANEPPGLIIGGDLTLIRDRIAVGGSRFAAVSADQSAHFRASVAVLIEALEAKGTASALGGSRAAIARLVPRLGADAMRRAFALSGGERAPSGPWRVILGQQPIAEILNYMIVPSLTTSAFYAASSAYHGRFGQPVMDERLSLADDPCASGGAVRRRISCEGLPAAKVDLIHAGRLVGLLSNHYDSRRLAADEHRADKLGADAAVSFGAGNGFRLGEGGERRFDAHPGSSGSNILMRSRGGVDLKRMLAAVGDGIYIGRVWYTYPINGQRAGDFTCTVSGDSYLIRNGKIGPPLVPNCLRINGNIEQIFAHPIAVGARAEPAAIVWGSPEAYYVPAIAAEAIPLTAVGADD